MKNHWVASAVVCPGGTSYHGYGATRDEAAVDLVGSMSGSFKEVRPTVTVDAEELFNTASRAALSSTYLGGDFKVAVKLRNAAQEALR